MLTFIKFCTSLGRTSPWFGGAVSGPVRLRTAPSGQEAVGIYGTLDEVSALLSP